MSDLPAAGTDATTPRPPPLHVLVLITALGPLAMHAVLPALPRLADVFAIPDDRIGYAVTSYLAGFAGAQLVVGPLSDRFGRRPIILGGLCLFLAATVGCLLAPSAAWLFAMRTLQAIGGCAGMVLGRAILRDCYSRDAAASQMGYLVTAMAVGTMLAPSVGALVLSVSDWEGVFVFLGTLGLVAVALAISLLPETNLAPVARLHVGFIVRSYTALLRSPVFLGHALNSACQNAVWFAFVTAMPVVLATIYGRPVAEYGLWIILPMSGYVMGSFIAGRISMRVGTQRMIRTGMGITTLGLAAIAILALTGALEPRTLFAAMTLYVIGNGIALPSVTAAAISVNPAVTGSAARLMGFVHWTAGVLATTAVSIAGLTNLNFLYGLIFAFGAAAFLTLPMTRER